LSEVETKKIIDTQEEYVEALKKKQAEFHANYLAAIDRIAQAVTIKELEACKIKVKKNAEEIDKLLQ
jgi:predicted house-cleaning noncanonical NTP pyrophosphatase (MazG superfamily)